MFRTYKKHTQPTTDIRDMYRAENQVAQSMKANSSAYVGVDSNTSSNFLSHGNLNYASRRLSNQNGLKKTFSFRIVRISNISAQVPKEIAAGTPYKGK